MSLPPPPPPLPPPAQAVTTSASAETRTTRTNEPLTTSPPIVPMFGGAPASPELRIPVRYALQGSVSRCGRGTLLCKVAAVHRQDRAGHDRGPRGGRAREGAGGRGRRDGRG